MVSTGGSKPAPVLMFKTSGSGEYHSDAILVAGVNHFLVPDGTAGLHDNLYSRIFNGINAISEREKKIGRASCRERV